MIFMVGFHLIIYSNDTGTSPAQNTSSTGVASGAIKSSQSTPQLSVKVWPFSILMIWVNGMEILSPVKTSMRRLKATNKLVPTQADSSCTSIPNPNTTNPLYLKLGLGQPILRKTHASQDTVAIWSQGATIKIKSNKTQTTHLVPSWETLSIGCWTA